MAETKKSHEFQWNSEPGFFTKQPMEDERITMGPELSWPLMTPPESEEALIRQREKVRRFPGIHQKAA